jgi:nucleoside-diphosphate-sugar epimerase
VVIHPHQTNDHRRCHNDRRFDVNVKGTFHVFETARRAGVCRVVHLSSLMVTWGHAGPALVPGDAPPRTVGTYALTKTLSEEIARHYATRYGLEVITLHIAAPLDGSDPSLAGRCGRSRCRSRTWPRRSPSP